MRKVKELAERSGGTLSTEPEDTIEIYRERMERIEDELGSIPYHIGIGLVSDEQKKRFKEYTLEILDNDIERLNYLREHNLNEEWVDCYDSEIDHKESQRELIVKEK